MTTKPWGDEPAMPTIIYTPLEINKKIGELKGMPLENFQVNGQKIYVDYKNWAENISDAWELFEEMSGGLITKNDSTEDGRDLYHCKNDSMDYLEWAYTAPLAICLAWIQWKESQR